MVPEDVHVGIRVRLQVSEPRPSLRYPARVSVTGTVVTVDTPGLPPGVQVELDRQVGGGQRFYATYHDLEPGPPHRPPHPRNADTGRISSTDERSSEAITSPTPHRSPHWTVSSYASTLDPRNSGTGA
jgi:hypothetical protein